MDEQAAPGLPRDRPADRLEEAGGHARVRDPLGWLLGRGLVQRPACPDWRCDDGIRLDTRGDCPSCASLIADRRAVRPRIRARAAADLPGAGTTELRNAFEGRLREDVALDAGGVGGERRAREAAEVERTSPGNRSVLFSSVPS